MSQKGLAPILIIMLIAAGIGVAYYFGYDHGWEKSINSPTTQPSPTSSPSDETADWKIESFEPFGTGWILSYKYPADWHIESNKYSSGHPNYAILFSSDKSLCINYTITSEGENTTVDEMIDTGLRDWDSASSPGEISAKEDILINGKNAKLVTVNQNGKTFKAVAGYLGQDGRYPTNRVFAFLTSCSMKESDILEKIVKSISVK